MEAAGTWFDQKTILVEVLDTYGVALVSPCLRMAHYRGIRCGCVLYPNVARPLSREWLAS